MRGMPRAMICVLRTLAAATLAIALALPAAALADSGKGHGNGQSGGPPGQAAGQSGLHGGGGGQQAQAQAAQPTVMATVLPGGTEGRSPSNPDARGAGSIGQGVDKPYAAAGQKAESQQYGGATAYFDGNNGCGQDKHSGEARETDTAHTGWDDNNGWCGRKPTPTAAAGARARSAEQHEEVKHEQERAAVHEHGPREAHGVEVAGVQAEHEQVPAPETPQPAAPETPQPAEQVVATTMTAPGGVGPGPEMVTVVVPQVSAPAAVPPVVVQGVQVPGAIPPAALAAEEKAAEQAGIASPEQPAGEQAAAMPEVAGEVAGVQAPGMTGANEVAGIQTPAPAAQPAAVAPPAVPAAVAGAQSPFVNLMPSTGQPLLDYGLLGVIPTALAGAGLAIARLGARRR